MSSVTIKIHDRAEQKGLHTACGSQGDRKHDRKYAKAGLSRCAEGAALVDGVGDHV